MINKILLAVQKKKDHLRALDDSYGFMYFLHLKVLSICLRNEVLLSPLVQPFSGLVADLNQVLVDLVLVV